MRTQNIFIMLAVSFGICFSMQALPEAIGLDVRDDTPPVLPPNMSVVRKGCLEIYFYYDDEKQPYRSDPVETDTANHTHLPRVVHIRRVGNCGPRENSNEDSN